MKKGKLLLLGVAFIFSIGHTTNYNVTIDDKIKEDIDIKISDGDIKNPSNLIDTIISDKVYVFLNNKDNVLYNKIVSKNENITKVNLKHTYSVSEFEKARYFNTCFQNTIFINRNNYLYIKGYDGFYCSGGDTMNISVTTNKLVINHNADKVNGNTYIWSVNQKKYKDFVLEFQVDLIKNTNTNKKNNNMIISPLKIFIGIIVGIASIVLIVIIDRKKREKF